MEIQPFYPVISALYGVRKSGDKYTIANDFEASSAAVANYLKNTEEEGQKINRRIDDLLKKYAWEKIALWESWYTYFLALVPY